MNSISPSNPSLVLDAIDRLDPALDHAKLRAIGLESLRRTAAETWTDHMPHDPGITLLEVLSYAISDVAYRCHFNIEDILAESNAQGRQTLESALPTARQMLTTGPVTLSDYRRQILDHPNLRNAVVREVRDPLQPTSGLLEIFADPTAKTDEELAPALEVHGLRLPVRRSDAKTLTDLLTADPRDSLRMELDAAAMLLVRTWGLPKSLALELAKPLGEAFAPESQARAGLQDSIGCLIRARTVQESSLAACNLLDALAASPPFVAISGRPIGLMPAIRRIQVAAGKREALVREVASSFAQSRAAGHDLQRVVIRPAFRVCLRFHARLQAGAHASDTLAQALHRISRHLEPSPAFLTLGEMMTRCSQDACQAFDGPALEHGFLHPDDLEFPPSRLHVSDLARILFATPGIADVSQLQLRAAFNQGDEDAPEWGPELSVPDECRAALAEVSAHEISGMEFSVDDVALRWARLEKKRPDTHLLCVPNESPDSPGTADRDIDIPKGRFRDLSFYSSVMRDLPSIYRVEPNAPGPDAPARILAPSRQLMAYLTLFDQVLANCLAQLSRLGELYSWSPTHMATRFSQGLENAIESLGILHTQFSPESAIDSAIQVKALANYHRDLQQLRDPPEESALRRNHFLDHLLDRFGRRVEESIAETRPGPTERLEVLWSTIRAKMTLLRDYPSLSARRAQGTIQGAEFSQSSGLCQWLAVRLDLPESNPNSQRYVLRFIEAPSSGPTELQPIHSDHSLRSKDGCPVDTDAVLLHGRNNEGYRIRFIEKPSPSPISEQPAMASPLAESDASDVPTPGRKLGHWEVSLECPEVTDVAEEIPEGCICARTRKARLAGYPRSFQLDGEFESRSDAQTAIAEFILHLENYNRLSERIELVEHVFLRPAPEELEFRLLLRNTEGIPQLGCASVLSSNQIRDIVAPVFPTDPSGRSPGHLCDFSIEPGSGDGSDYVGWRIIAKLPASTGLKLASLRIFETHRAALQQLKTWQEDFSKSSGGLQWGIAHNPWGPSADQLDPHNPGPDPYSHTGTLIIPTWPTRFQSPRFKRLVQSLVLSEVPAVLSVRIAWLDHGVYQQFNRLRRAWTDARDEARSTLPVATADLRAFLGRLQA